MKPDDPGATWDDVRNCKRSEWQKWEGDCILRALDKLIPMVEHCDDAELHADFRVLLHALRKRWELEELWSDRYIKSGFRGNDNPLPQRDKAINDRAQALRAAGKKRGLASAVKREMGLELSVRQIERILAAEKKGDTTT